MGADEESSGSEQEWREAEKIEAESMAESKEVSTAAIDRIKARGVVISQDNKDENEDEDEDEDKDEDENDNEDHDDGRLSETSMNDEEAQEIETETFDESGKLIVTKKDPKQKPLTAKQKQKQEQQLKASLLADKRLKEVDRRGLARFTETIGKFVSQISTCWMLVSSQYARKGMQRQVCTPMTLFLTSAWTPTTRRVGLRWSMNRASTVSSTRKETS